MYSLCNSSFVPDTYHVYNTRPVGLKLHRGSDHGPWAMHAPYKASLLSNMTHMWVMYMIMSVLHYSAHHHIHGPVLSNSTSVPNTITVDMNVESSYDPLARAQRSLRSLRAKDCALLFIDVQRYTCLRSSPLYKDSDQDLTYFFDRIGRVCRRNWATLIREARKKEVHILTCVISSMRRDGADRSLDYKLSGFQVFAPNPKEELLPEIYPDTPNEICLAKTSSSVFQSTNINYLLRNLGVRQLIVCGCLTDQCVDHACRDACDLGYLVTVVDDACATFSEDRHKTALQAFSGYCRRLETVDVVQELSQ